MTNFNKERCVNILREEYQEIENVLTHDPKFSSFNSIKEYYNSDPEGLIIYVRQFTLPVVKSFKDAGCPIKRIGIGMDVVEDIESVFGGKYEAVEFASKNFPLIYSFAKTLCYAIGAKEAPVPKAAYYCGKEFPLPALSQYETGIQQLVKDAFEHSHHYEL